MLLTYTPEDAERQEFQFRPQEMLSVEAEKIEELGPWVSFEDFLQRLSGGNFKARRALLWVFLRRTDPKLRFVDLVVKFGEVGLEYEAQEIQRIRDAIAGDDNLSDEDKEQALAELDDGDTPAIAAPEPEGKGDGGDSDTATT